MLERLIEVLEEVLDLLDPEYEDTIEEIEDVLIDLRNKGL